MSTKTLPFDSRYIKERILNYGKPYTDYKTYQIINEKLLKKNIDDDNDNDNIKIIYVDNKTCSHNCTKLFTSNLSYYVEIHYTLESKKPVLETIMKTNEIEELLSKSIYVLLP